MATKESEVASNEHPTYQQADGTSGHDLGRQISVTLTPQQFEGEFAIPTKLPDHAGKVAHCSANRD